MDIRPYDSCVDRAARVLTSAGFIAGLIVLLANDFVLKQAYPGAITGKLSDVAGLFIFPMFFAAFWPRRSREIYAATALAFAWWKSPWSQGAIDGWNALPLWDVGRVVDWMDLFALAVLPLSYVALRRPVETCSPKQRRRSATAILAAATFALAASTSISLFGEDRLEYMFEEDDPAAVVAVPFSTSELTRRLDASGVQHGESSVGLGGPRLGEDVMMDNDCNRAWFRGESESALRILGLESSGHCKQNRDQLVELFRSDFVPRLAGSLPPLAYRPPDEGDFYAYPADAGPTVVLTGTMLDAQERLDTKPFFAHEVHDGVYYMDVCGGRFRLIERAEVNEIVVVGIGYVKPCTLGDDDGCLESWFRFWLTVGDPTPERSEPTPVATICALGGE